MSLTVNDFSFEQKKSSKGSSYLVATGADGRYFANIAVGLNGELGIKLQGMKDPLTEEKPADVTIILGA